MGEHPVDGCVGQLKPVLSEEELRRIDELLASPEFDAAMKKLDEEAANAPHCIRCNDRCDGMFGDGTMCNPCRSKPTSECYQIVINI